MNFPVTARQREWEKAQEEWVGGVIHKKRACRSNVGVKEFEAEMVRDKKGAGLNKSIVHGCGMKGRLLPACG